MPGNGVQNNVPEKGRGGAESVPNANSAPMKVKIANFFVRGSLAKDLYRV